MKNRQGLPIMLALALMGMAACNSSVEDITFAEKEKEESLWAEKEEIEVKTITYGTKEIFLEGKKLEQLTVVGADDTFYCNLEENMKPEYGMESTPVLVCKDPVYDITYYVNYGRDEYIYAYREEMAELVVAIPARDLFCREGELYFIADTDARYQCSGFAPGNILKYNPKDGSVTVVVACNADGMAVYPDGICYKQIGEIKQTESRKSVTEEFLFFSFATEESFTLPKNVNKLRRWKEYLLQEQYVVREVSESDPMVQQLRALGYNVVGEGEVEAIRLVDVWGEGKETLQTVNAFLEGFWIGGDFLYYIEERKEAKETESRSVLNRYDMESGTQEEVAVLAYATKLSTSDMLLFNGVVYFGNKLRVALDDGTQCYMQNADGTSAQLDFFYTDGENVFCVSGGKLWRFHEWKNDSVAEGEFVAGMPLAIGAYVYRLYEP